eukprot:scaffold72575_cov44-Phaeocystis_antarctica.AAC.2
MARGRSGPEVARACACGAGERSLCLWIRPDCRASPCACACAARGAIAEGQLRPGPCSYRGRANE